MSSSVAMRRRRLAVRLTTAAGVWAVGLLLAALLLPAYNDQTVVNSSGVTLTTATFVQVNGAWVLIPIAAPLVAFAAVAFALRREPRRGSGWARTAAWGIIGLLGVLSLVTIATIGGLMLPVVVMLALALRLVPGSSDRGGRPAKTRGPARAA